MRFYSKDFGCHEHFLMLVQFPWHCMECEIRSDKSIIRGLLQPSWGSCLSKLDLGCSMPRTSIRFVPQFRISVLINPVPTFRRTSKYVSSCQCDTQRMRCADKRFTNIETYVASPDYKTNSDSAGRANTNSSKSKSQFTN
jgi:hypothetical protein